MDDPCRTKRPLRALSYSLRRDRRVPTSAVACRERTMRWPLRQRASRLCVRTVLCSSAFLLVPSSPSTDSAADRSALFASFAGTIDESDFFAPFIIGYGLRPSQCSPGDGFPGRDEDLPVPAQEMCVHAQGLMTTRGGQSPRDDGPVPVAFCMPRRHRHPELHCFRRSIPRLYAPLSTLRVMPRGSIPRMTRGQCGSLLLHCNGLSPSPSCRSSRRTVAQFPACRIPCQRFAMILADSPCITRGRGGWLGLTPWKTSTSYSLP